MDFKPIDVVFSIHDYALTCDIFFHSLDRCDCLHCLLKGNCSDSVSCPAGGHCILKNSVYHILKDLSDDKFFIGFHFTDKEEVS